MTGTLTALTTLGVLLVGIGSFLLHDGRHGYHFVAVATEVVGGAAVGLSWLIGLVSDPPDCYAPGADCPTTYVGFAWFVLGDGVLEATFAFLAFVAGWVLAKLHPSSGQQDYSRVDGVFGNFNPPPPLVSTPGLRRTAPPRPVLARPAQAEVLTSARVTINDLVAHLVGPDSRSACGRVLSGYRPAQPQTQLCQLCAKRSSAQAP